MSGPVRVTCSTCGWDSPGYADMNAATAAHAKHACLPKGLCAICTNVRLGKMEDHDEKRCFICTICSTETPRSGRYSFGESASRDVPAAGTSRKAAHT